MRQKAIINIFLVLFSAIALWGISYFGIAGYAAYSGINLGLDLRGGATIVYEADREVTADEMRAAVSLIQGRLDSRGYTEAEVSRQGTNRLRVEIPGIDDVDQAIDFIGRTAQLLFADDEGNVLLDGSVVRNAQPTTSDNQIVVALDFDSVGQALFAEATGNNIGRPIFIILDDEIISAPMVNERITGGSAVITGGFSVEEAETLAALIRAGALPFNLNVLSMNLIGARLGAASLETSIFAGIIGFILIAITMVVLYRAAGLAADLALIIFLALQLIVLSLFGVTLTLPGIAGIILSIGMAVDANIIIFERIKEELLAGKSLRVACDIGFKRATPAIIDANITTIMVGIILFWLGTGPIMGFAQTLVIGIVVSMFTAMVITRFLVKSMVKAKLVNPSWYCSMKEKAPPSYSIVENRTKFFLISCGLLCIGLVFMVTNMTQGRGAFNYDVVFSGGTEITVDLGQSVEQSHIVQVVSDATGQPTPQVQQILGTHEVNIRVQFLEADERATLIDALIVAYNLPADTEFAVSDVSATISAEMISSAVMAVAVAAIAILAYVAIRFRDVYMGGAAIIALLHDVALVVITYAVFRIPLNHSFIAVLLTVLGYSINATIIIFDRVRENRPRFHSPKELLNASIWQTFTRCVYTSVTLLMATVSLYIFGVTSVRDFSLPISVGVIIGTYSSICFTGAVWFIMNKRKGSLKNV